MKQQPRQKGKKIYSLHAVVDELLKDEQQEWEEVLEKIASGNSEWLEAAACLSHGVYFGLNLRSDYADATLSQALAQALLKNPNDVLRRDEEISLTVLCSLPRNSRGKTVEFADDFLEKALSAVEIADDDDDYNKRHKKACAFYLQLVHERFINQVEEYKNGH